MKSDRIKNSLEKIFQDDNRWTHNGRRIVFWYDAEQQFQEVFDSLQLESVTKYQLGDAPFTAKYHLLIEQPKQAFLIYAPFAEPSPAENWLIDIQKYSQVFSADRAALIFADFHFHQRHLESLIRQHLKFFDSSKRANAISAMNLEPQTSDRELYLAMLSVLAGEKVANLDMLLRQVLIAGLLESDNKLWIEFEKFNLGDAFWAIVRDSTGFTDKKPSLRNLFVSLLITHFQMTVRGGLPEQLRGYAIAPSQKAYAFVEHWTNDRTLATYWIKLSKQIEAELNIESAIVNLSPEALYESKSFECINLFLIRACVREIKAEASDLNRWQKWFDVRRNFVWHEKYAATYEALSAAIELLELKRLHLNFLTLADGISSLANSLFEVYTQSLYLCDRTYRKFIVASDASQPILREQGVIEFIENLYVNWFLEGLGKAWTEAIVPLQNNWQLTSISSQQDFFKNYIHRILQSSDREKVFVLISDAFRYEVATELKEQIEQELRGTTKIDAQLGLLPSITPVGMAALLSGTKLEFSTDFEDVLCDGISTKGADARQKVLQKSSQVEAIVIGAADLLKMTTEEGREKIKPHRLIYIYHDSIDAIGDKTASERQVMSACDNAIAELLKLVKRICNSLNGTRVFITADHGFLYQRKPISEPDKLNLPKDDEILKTSRRYLLRSQIPNHQSPTASTTTLEFTMPYDTKGAIVVVPRSNLRFAKQGAGSQFVHGGASLQEICVPVIIYHHKRAEKGDEGAIQKVGVQVSARNRRVTNNRFTVSLLQTDPVEGRWRSRQISLALYDPQTNDPITDLKIVELNSISPQPTAREFPQTLTITVGNPPVSAYLIVRDTADNQELIRETWTVSLAISNDFGDF